MADASQSLETHVLHVLVALPDMLIFTSFHVGPLGCAVSPPITEAPGQQRSGHGVDPARAAAEREAVKRKSTSGEAVIIA